MYIENREKIEKILTNLVKEMERQGIIEVDKKKLNLILKMLGSMKLSKCWKR